MFYSEIMCFILYFASLSYQPHLLFMNQEMVNACFFTNRLHIWPTLCQHTTITSGLYIDSIPTLNLLYLQSVYDYVGK